MKTGHTYGNLVLNWKAGDTGHLNQPFVPNNTKLCVVSDMAQSFAKVLIVILFLRGMTPFRGEVIEQVTRFKYTTRFPGYSQSHSAMTTASLY